MSHTKDTLITHDGLRLYTQYWTPPKKIMAVVCLIHGLGEHSKRYKHVAEKFIKNNIATVAIDLRGHGRSLGKRGHIDDYGLFLEDITLMLKKAKDLFPDKPIFLYGHSMGGNLVLNYSLKLYPEIQGIISSSPWLELSLKPGLLKTFFANLLSKLWPSYSENRDLPSSTLSADPKVGEAYDYDPLCHNRISAKLFADITKNGIWNIKNAATFSSPLLLMHGSKDKVTSPSASIEFAKHCPNNCKLKLWPDCFHELHNEINKEEIIQYIIDWIKKELKKKKKFNN